MRTTIQVLAAALSLGLAAPAMAASADDARDTATEKKAEAHKKVRHLKGSESAEDRASDAKDTATATSARTKKSARKAARKSRRKAHDATK